MEVDFKRDLEPLRGRRIDLAMAPLDPRLGAAEGWGLEYLLKTALVRRVLPMHQWRTPLLRRGFAPRIPSGPGSWRRSPARADIFAGGKSVKIDGNELAVRQNDLDRAGRHQEALELKREFLRQVRESGDHCPCPEACPHHGNCFECVTLHRGHRDHLPMCMWDMVNQRLSALSHMTEGSLERYEAARDR
jgi:hypothetical protein